jgi:redox-sensitive bicupin YhaK (pirin superfamily)
MYVREGAIAQEDSTGRLDIIRAGEFSRMTDGPGLRWTATNASHTEWAHVFQVCLGNAAASVDPGCEKKRFSAAERRGKLCVVASPDGRGGSLRVHHDALLCSAMFGRGRHVVHELPRATCAWLHVVAGEITLRDDVLTEGDGAGVTDDLAVSFTARRDSEVLLLHLGEPDLVFPNHGSAP